MLGKEDVIRLRHMLGAARKACEFAEGQTRRALDGESVLSYALVRCLEIVGEAAAQVSPEGRGHCPGLPWPMIVGMRNRLIHAYFDINLDRVWETITEDLPALIAELERVLAEERPL